MLKEIHELSYNKDVKYIIKKHYNFSTLLEVLEMLKNYQILPNKYKNHILKGNLKGFWECHIDSNIILIYKIENNNLFLVRLGTHSDILRK